MILLQNGDRINKKKIIKIEKFLSDKTLDLLLFTSDTTRILDNQSKSYTLRVNQNNQNKLIEILVTMNSHIKKIENQNKIFNFLHNFFKNTNERINNKINKLTSSYEYFKCNKNDLDINFSEQINKFKNLFKDTWYLKNIAEDEIEKNIQNIDKAFTEFSKIYRIYEHKLKSFNSLLNQFRERNILKQKENIVNEVPSDYEKIKKLYDEYNKNPKEITIKIEKEKILNNELVNSILSTLQTNSSKLKLIIDDDGERLKREVINKIAELNLLRKNIEHNIDVCLIPKVFKLEMKELEKEIISRKEFDLTFKAIITYINNNLLAKEEIRRKE